MGDFGQQLTTERFGPLVELEHERMPGLRGTPHDPRQCRYCRAQMLLDAANARVDDSWWEED